MSAARRSAAVLLVILCASLTAGAAVASAPVSVSRCGYAHSRYWGKVALYPWHMTCAAATRTLAGSELKHAPTINFSADGADTFDAAAVKIAGKWWVCGGRMGSYFCGYPYRPATAPGEGGGSTYKGPFTQEFMEEACSDGGSQCGRHDQTFQPPLSYR